ncbi:MAG: hypothetical protein K5683_09760 [Prevotella sp.]|nr:hypothetical protein [Prevotella sp.]
MKKLILTSAVLLMALIAQAQTMISPKLENGFKAMYTEANQISVGGQELKINIDQEYAVSDVSANGAVITVTITDTQMEGGSEDANMAGQMLLIPVNMRKGVAFKLATDANGQVQKIMNYDEAKAAVTKNLEELVGKMLADNPEIGQMLPKDKLIEQFSNRIKEQTLLEDFKESGVLALNGKQVANGAVEDIEKEGLQMKRMYFIAGQNIITNANVNMTKDQLKEFIIKQVEEQAPEQAEMIKKNIDMVMGQMKIEISEKNTYTMNDNGWVKSIKGEASQDIMGQSLKQSTVTTLKQ